MYNRPVEGVAVVVGVLSPLGVEDAEDVGEKDVAVMINR